MSSSYNSETVRKAFMSILALAAFGWAIYFSLTTISTPYQIEYREGTAQAITQLILQGKNPFSLDYQPQGVTLYGIGYYLIAAPFSAVFGNSLALHRSLSVIFGFLASVMAWDFVRQKTNDRSGAFLCASFVLIGLLSRAGLGAFPSSMGSFLFLLSLLIPWKRSFDRASLVISAMLSIFAFFTKPYFILSFGVVLAYVFLFVSKRKSLEYAFYFFLAFLPLFIAVRHFLPLYFVNTIGGNVSMSLPSTAHMMWQLALLWKYFYPVAVAAGLAFGLQYKNHQTEFHRDLKSVRLALNFDAPFITGVQLNFPFFFFMCALTAFISILGPHQGTVMTYAYQLVTPTFFIWVFSAIGDVKSARFALTIAAAISLYWWVPAELSPQMLEQKASMGWARVFEYIQSSERVLNSPVVASELARLGMEPIDSGQTSLYYLLDPYSNSLFTAIPYKEYQEDGLNFILTIDRMIEKKRFDLIVISKEKAPFYHSKRIPMYYDLIDTISVEMPQFGQIWTLEIWKPKPE